MTGHNLRFTMHRRPNDGGSELWYSFRASTGRWVTGHLGIGGDKPLSNGLSVLKEILVSNGVQTPSFSIPVKIKQR